jgi:hypothetical protein
MIQPDARSRLTPTDVALVLQSVTGRPASPPEADLWVQTVDLDEALDRPEVAALLRATPIPGPSPSLFFYVQVRRALLDHGVTDRRIADYCAALLREFGYRDRAYRVAKYDDHRHQYLVDILADAAATSGERQFRVLVHLGDFALWFAGVFPERIEARRVRRGGPDLSYYEALGGQGYAEASDHWLAEHVGLADIFRAAADQFGTLRQALNTVQVLGPRQAN